METACKEGHLLQGRLHHIRKSAEPLALAPILQLHQATAVVRENVIVSSALYQRHVALPSRPIAAPFCENDKSPRVLSVSLA